MTTTVTLADLAATSLGAIRILEQHGLDYCCGGKQLFDQACVAKGIQPETLIREIEEAKRANAAGRDWQTAPLDELVKHIVGTHHAYLKLELPALGRRLDKVVSVHGARDPEVFPRMSEVFAALRAERLVALEEGFADRRYAANGQLVARGPPGALIEHSDEMLAQALSLVKTGTVIAQDGSICSMHVDTICLHGDGSHALEWRM